VYGRQEPSDRKKAWREFVNGQNDILVSTNLASRGLDTMNVGHVILYDFPTTMADYLHRVGRTARAGEDGRVTALFSKRDISVVKSIKGVTDSAFVEFRSSSKRLGKALNLRKFDQAMAKFKKSGNDTKRKYLALRKRFGLSKQDWLGSPEKVKMMKHWHNEKKDAKKLKFLRQRGTLGKKEEMPVMPDGRIERSDSQVFNDLNRDEKGSLLITARRRSASRTFESDEGQIELQGLGKFKRKVKSNQV
jgi:superfamily II DNA/RNA helicase